MKDTSHTDYINQREQERALREKVAEVESRPVLTVGMLPGGIIMDPPTYQVVIHPSIAAPTPLTDRHYTDIRLMYHGPAVPPDRLSVRISTYTFHLPDGKHVEITVGYWARIPIAQAQQIIQVNPQYHQWELRPLYPDTLAPPPDQWAGDPLDGPPEVTPCR